MNYFKTKPKRGYGYIYKYTSPSGKSYIGQTVRSLHERYSGGSGYVKCTAFSAALQKYGFENFSIEILEECGVTELDDREFYYIQKFGTTVPNGYNIASSGGDKYYSRENRRRRGVKQYSSDGAFIKEYGSLQDAANDNGVLYQAISEVLRGIRPHCNGYIYRYSNDNSPVKAVEVIKTHGRLTGQYDLDGNLIEVHESASQAARAIGKNSSAGRNIRSVCYGDRKTAYGYKWKFLD